MAGTTTVACGELELDDAGSLVLHVTAIPGRPDLTAGPSLVADVGEAPTEVSRGAGLRDGRDARPRHRDSDGAAADAPDPAS